MRADHVEMSVIVWSSVLDVEAFLGRITDIATCLPDIDSATLADSTGRSSTAVPSTDAEQAGAVMLVRRGRCAAIADHQMSQTHGRIQWRLSGPVEYSGTIEFFGDASVTQLRSRLAVGPTSDEVTSSAVTQGAALVNSLFLRELARRIEERQVASVTEMPARRG